MNKGLKQNTNFEEESTNQTNNSIQKDCKEDEFRKGKTNNNIDNQISLSLNDKYEIKGSDQNKEMFKDIKGEQMKSIKLSHISDRRLNEMEHANNYLDDEFM